MSSRNSRSIVRQSLAQNTRLAHLELHKHKWISALARNSITSSCYYQVLTAYREFYWHVEQHRMQLALYPLLSLADAVHALDQDVRVPHLAVGSMGKEIALEIADKPSLLGALYVLHGAGFGASILNRNVQQNLPAASRNFLSTATSQSTWQRLNTELELLVDRTEARESLEAKALETFNSFGAFVTLVCESQRAGLVQGIKPTV